MADLTDVEAALVNIVGAAIYPNGFGQPSVLPGAAAAKIGRGWPIPSDLDTALAAGNIQVTVYPLSGSATPTYQILDHTYTITPPAINLMVSVVDTVITVTGQPAAGEYLTLILDDAVVCSQGGATTAALLAALATQAQGFGYAASSTLTTLTTPFGHSMVVRQGGQAVMGKVIHRQRQSVMVTVWAPNDAVRTAAAILADIAVKENIKITLPDTSECIIRYLRSMSSDQTEKADLYRRDLIYDCEFATVQQFPGYVVTSSTISIAKPDNSAIATALT